MNNFIYNVPVKVYFGENQLGYLGEELTKYGNRILLIYGGDSIKKIGLYDKVIGEIKKNGIELYELSGIKPNPHIDFVRQGVQLCKDNRIEVILAVGGGSTIDVAKFIAAGAMVEHDSWLFFNRWAPIEKALPIVTILTLAASGTEMDCAGVITNPETKEKRGRFDIALYPKTSFLDPTCTYSVNAYQTAVGAVDSMSHVMEEYFTMTPDLYMLDCIMEGMMKTIIKYAPIAIREPDNYEARANLMWVSSWAINGFVRGGKKHAWSCHPMEHELTAFYNITHGHGLAILLPRWLSYCLDETTVTRYAQFGKNVFEISATLPMMEIARKSIERLEEFFYITLDLSNCLADLGIERTNFAIMAKRACRHGLRYAFKSLDYQDVVNIYEMCL